jgi:phospholipid N-methyltransferase
MFGDAALFFGLWLQKPLQIAAIAPSSTRLATVMANLVDWSRPGRCSNSVPAPAVSRAV